MWHIKKIISISIGPGGGGGGIIRIKIKIKKTIKLPSKNFVIVLHVPRTQTQQTHTDTYIQNDSLLLFQTYIHTYICMYRQASNVKCL